MFASIFLFELRYRLRRPATWIYFGLLALMAALLVLAAGGAFGTGVNVGLGSDGQTVKINAPYSLQAIFGTLSIFGILIASSLMGNPVYRDFEHRTFSLFYTTPITKWGYLAGRFLGSYVIAALVFSGLAIGAALAASSPWVIADRFLATAPAGSYVWPYMVLVLPNLFFTGAIFFTTATLTRNILSTYIGSVILLVAYLTASAFIEDLKNEYLISALDAYGFGAFEMTTRYWTPAEKNAQLLPLSSYMLLNRAIWVGIGVGLLALCYARFRFSAFASEKVSKRRKMEARGEREEAGGPLATRLPSVQQSFSFGMHLSQWWSLTRLEFWGIVRSLYFAAIVGAGVVFLLANASQIGKFYDTNTYPVTGEVVYCA